MKTPIQIRFNDVDLAGHVHNGVYLNFFEQGRMEYINKVLIDGKSDWDWKRNSLILAKNVIDYRKPIYLDDSIFVETFFVKAGNKSFTLGYKVVRVNESDTEVCAEGESVLVCYDYLQKSTIAIPEAWNKKFKEQA